MSAVATHPTHMSAAIAPVPMTRLVNVELRKMVDTRAGRWLLVSVSAATAVVLVIALATGDADTRSFSNLAALAQLPMSVLIPVLGILAATSEWTQRTVLTTFALVPARGRVINAKLLASIALALAAVVFTLVVAAIAALIAPLFGTTDADWSLGAADVGQFVIYQVLSIVMGFAFGTVLLNSAVAIVLYFVLPTVWAGLTTSFESLSDAQKWLDTSTSWLLLIEPDKTLGGTEWAQVGATSAFWIGIPMAIGLARVLRREVD